MRQLRVLVACECSGRVRDAFAARGWEAWSADLLPSETLVRWTGYPGGTLNEVDPVHPDALGYHYQGDVRDLFRWNHPVNKRRVQDQDVAWGTDRFAPKPPLWDLIIAHPPCFTAGTPVITDRGVIGIEQVKAGDRVLTHKGRWQPVTHIMSRTASVITDGQITATPDHPFWAREKAAKRYGRSTATGGGNPLPFELKPPTWTAAAETRGKFLAIPARAEAAPVPACGSFHQGEAFWYMVGRWLGDGWTRIQGNPGHNHFDTMICCAYEEADELAERLAETGLAWRRSEERTTTRFTLSNTYLCRWLEQHFGKYAAGKTLPGWLFGVSESIRATVLAGYLAADGSHPVTGSPSLVSQTSTVSRNLAVGIRVLATTLGYTTTMTKNFRAGPALIEHRVVRQQDSWSVILRKDDGRFTRFEDGLRWVKQRREWREAGEQTVYDITVAEDHSFTAYGFAVHNCTDLSYAGARWFKDKDSRRGGDGRMQQAADFFMEMLNAPSHLVAVENPHSVIQEPQWAGPPTQVVQPWWFGDPFEKQIHLWLRGLPPLQAEHTASQYPGLLTRATTGGGSWRTDKAAQRRAMSAYEDSEGRKNRAKVRSRTFPGFARAMAEQWGTFAEEYYA